MDIIKQLFDDIDGEKYEEFKELTFDILKFRVIEEKDVTREFYLEKIYDYLEVVNIKNDINPRKYAYVSIYTDTLLALLDNKAVKGSRAEKYLKKAKLIKTKIKENESNCCEMLKDFTRIFVGLYLKNVESKQPLENFDFFLSNDNLLKVIDGLKNEKKAELFGIKEKNLVNIKDRYSKMTYILFFLELIYLNMLSVREME